MISRASLLTLYPLPIQNLNSVHGESNSSWLNLAVLSPIPGTFIKYSNLALLISTNKSFSFAIEKYPPTDGLLYNIYAYHLTKPLRSIRPPNSSGVYGNIFFLRNSYEAATQKTLIFKGLLVKGDKTTASMDVFPDSLIQHRIPN